MRRSWSFVLLAAAAGACSSSGGFSDGGADASVDAPSETPMASLHIVPDNATLDVPYGTSPTLAYHALGVPLSGGAEIEVPATFQADRGGTFAGGTFTASGVAGGAVVVSASYGGASATTGLTLTLHEDLVRDGLPASLVGAILGASDDASLAPTLVYPEPDTVIPPNVPNVDWQWNGAVGDDVYLARLSSPGGFVDVLTSKTDVAFDATEWAPVVAILGPGPFDSTIYGAAQSDPTHAGKTSETLRLTQSKLAGAMYYWSSDGTYTPVQPNEDQTAPRGYFRYDFNATALAPSASSFLGFNRAGNVCVGCHSLSRDGTLLTTSFETDTHWATMAVASTDNPVVWTSGGPSDANALGNFSAYSADGKFLFVTGGTNIRVYAVGPGVTLLTTFVAPLPASHIATSPADPKVVLYVEDTTSSGGTRVGKGRIVRLDWDGQSLSNRTVWLEDSAASVYYPSISPDGSWVLFDRATSGISLSNTLAEVRAWRLDQTGQPVVLARADKGASLSNSWPKWAPFDGDDGSGALRWFFTFSSIRAYRGASLPQLWLSTFDPSATGDPSSPGLWLPMQSPTLHNHAAQWTEVFVQPPN
jgi:hypothetical protein